MKTRTAGFYFSFVVISFANRKLVIPALQILIKPFVGNDSFLCHVISFVMRLSSADELKTSACKIFTQNLVSGG